MSRAANRLSGDRLRRHATRWPPVLARRTVRCPRWPAELDGLRIGHISDFHVGELMTVDHAVDHVRAMESLRLDLLAVTGDIIDFHADGVEPLLEALAQFPTPLGTWAVPGNHDRLVDGGRFLNLCNEMGLQMLTNRKAVVEHRGKRLSIAGIDWARRTADLGHLVGRVFENGKAPHATANEASTTADGTILLAHNPKVFDHAAAWGADLVLAGHTHGGQLNLLHPRPRTRPIGLGSMAHRYSWGVYELGPSRLHVTSGVGSWFPFRVRCPSEIALLTIRHGA